MSQTKNWDAKRQELCKSSHNKNGKGKKYNVSFLLEKQSGSVRCMGKEAQKWENKQIETNLRMNEKFDETERRT